MVRRQLTHVTPEQTGGATPEHLGAGPVGEDATAVEVHPEDGLAGRVDERQSLLGEVQALALRHRLALAQAMMRRGAVRSTETSRDLVVTRRRRFHQRDSSRRRRALISRRRGERVPAASAPSAIRPACGAWHPKKWWARPLHCSANRRAMRVWDFVKETFSEWSEDRAPRMGAALAYYTVFSLAPVLVIAIGVAGIFFGERMAEGRLMDEIRGLVGPEGAGAIRAMIENAAADRSGGVVATIMGLAALIFGATGAFVELQDALNTIWEVKPKTRGL